MTLKAALKELIDSETFREKFKLRDKEGSKYRMFLSRYNAGKLKTGAAVDMLLDHGYVLDIKKAK